MSTRATATFQIDSFEQDAFDEAEGATLGRARLRKTFNGDVEGTSSVEMLTAQTAEAGSAAYVALERIVARLHGRSGSFVLHHSATSSRGQQAGTWLVVPDSGTGELHGLRGEAEIVVGPDGGHAFILVYDLD